MITKINQRKIGKNALFFVLCSLFFSVALLSSCQDMYEPADENNRQEDAMYEESQYANGLLMYGYSRLPYLTTTQTDVATDDAVSNVKTNTYLTMATGSWASDNNPMSQWDNCKDGIQYLNLFLSKVEKVKWAPSAISKQQMFVDRLKGEALGLRAVLYYYLLQAHGGYGDDGVLYGVPLLTTPEDGSSDFNQPRATFAECVQQVFADCDSAMALLPINYVDVTNENEIPAKYLALGAQKTGYNLVFGARSKGLMSGKVAEATKAQMALLAASPAFRDQSGVTSAEAATLCANVLNRIGGMAGFDPAGNIWYKNVNMLKPEAAEMPEMLWREDRQNNSTLEGEQYPPTLYGNGRVNPSQNLVDAFPMRNGYPISDLEKSGYNPKDPYTGRDPRLADNVLYNGTTFRKKVIVTGTYAAVNGEKSETDDNINSIATSTRTGYYLKKLLRDDVSPSASGSEIKQQHINPRIRYTEIFLAYAEAANDAWGPKVDGANVGFTAYDVIKAIRERAGLGTNEVGMPLPEGDAYLEVCAADQAKMTDLIRNERRIELCFENKRFWDLRRWLLPLNESVKGIMWEKIDAQKDPTIDNLKYTIIDVEDRKYDSSYQNYGPIPKGEVLKWSNLKQNKGWENN